MSDYRDPKLSVMISSPAGSGKTEKLARRYISLLLSGAEVERILCITFTEKAAAEMKSRILSIIEAEESELAQVVRPRIPLMRIATIHAFCLSILKRFSMELGLDPSLDVMDEDAAGALWDEALYECLMQERVSGGLLTELSIERGLRGWAELKKVFDEMHGQEPATSMYLQKEIQSPHARLLEGYRICRDRYNAKKLDGAWLDYQDLEFYAHRALCEVPQSFEILRAFDEHTDHLLVDEFQDTNALQWALIDKLTEEWRSGQGAKREAGKTPTVFLVGDEKQSIYLFRGAAVALFRQAHDHFTNWLGEEFKFGNVEDNYRSLPAITDFVNALFGRIMDGGLGLEPWRTQYSKFNPQRKGQGRVELMLMESAGSMKERRLKEARLMAMAMKSIVGAQIVYEGDNTRPCQFKDMALLLRRRTHLAMYEEALREQGIPFLVMKGIGFYEATEVALLRELVCFLVDPGDDYSLFCLLRSPFFGFDFSVLQGLRQKGKSLYEVLSGSPKDDMRATCSMLGAWVQLALELPLARVLEAVLSSAGKWSQFSEPQRYANIRKFISLVEGMETKGMGALDIREALIRQRSSDRVPKANVNDEVVNAVKIMTVHAAKGLQFPAVFLPALDIKKSPERRKIIVDVQGDSIQMHLEEDSGSKKDHPRFKLQKLMAEEEEKRLFYVAATRARDYLFMSGALGKKPEGLLEYMEQAFAVASAPGADLPFKIITPQDIEQAQASMPLSPAMPRAQESGSMYVAPLPVPLAGPWMTVTEELEKSLAGHGEVWHSVGLVMHSLLEELSRGSLAMEGLPERARVLLGMHGAGEMLDVVISDMHALRASGILERVVMPRQGAYCELPFVHEARPGRIYSGRMDRVIVTDSEVQVYDYKSFPAPESEIVANIEKYRQQLNVYTEAAARIFGMRARGYLVFTHEQKIIEVAQASL